MANPTEAPVADFGIPSFFLLLNLPPAFGDALLLSHSREHPQQSFDRDFPVFINKSFWHETESLAVAPAAAHKLWRGRRHPGLNAWIPSG